MMKIILSLLLCLLISVPAQAGQRLEDMFALIAADIAVVPDPALRAALLREIDDVNLWREKLEVVVSLEAYGADISDLTGLENLINLEGLSLKGNRVKDLSPLAGLNNLAYLDLSENLVTDARPLAGLESLEYLDLSKNRIIDAEPLSALKNLKRLNLSDNWIYDASALNDMISNGCEVKLEGNNIAETAPTPRLTPAREERNNGEYRYLRADGEIKILKYLKNARELAIPSEIDGYPLTRIGAGAFAGCESRKITIPDGVREIGERAFYGCGITDISIPDSVTKIGGGAFNNCKNLDIGKVLLPQGFTLVENALFDKDMTTLISYLYAAESSPYTVPDGVSKIGEQAFYGCDSLTEATLPRGATAVGDYAFARCENLSRVNLPADTSVIGGGAFFKCIALSAITIPDGATVVGDYAFYGCNALSEIIMPDSAIKIGFGAFKGCYALTVACSSDSYARKYCAENGVPVSPR